MSKYLSIVSRLSALSILVLLGACEFSCTTAHLSEIEISNAKDMTNQVTTFEPNDTIFMRSSVKANVGEATTKFSLVANELKVVDKKGTVLDVSNKLEGNMPVTATFSPPTNGWPEGSYSGVVQLIVKGKVESEKSIDFIVEVGE